MSLAGGVLESEPYPHFFHPRAMDPAFAERLLSWFEGDAPWKPHVEAGFYEAFDLDLRQVQLPDALSMLVADEFGRTLADQMEGIFATPFDPHIDVEAHKLQPGQVIRVHNDTGMEISHRVVIQLTRGWRAEHGGLLLLLGAPTRDRFHPADRVYPPLPGSCVGFAVSSRSHHAVTETRGGARYTLVLSFRPPGVPTQL